MLANGKPSANGANGRDSQGRFTPGNRGGPGNPFTRRVAALRAALCAIVTEKDIQELALQLLVQAKNGDLAAAKLLFTYAIGRPTDVVDPDSLDVKEWQLLQQAPMSISEMERLFSRLPTQVANTVVRAAWPSVGRDLALQLAERAQETPSGRDVIGGGEE